MKWVSSKIRNTPKKTNIRVEKTNLSFGEGKLGRGGVGVEWKWGRARDGVDWRYVMVWVDCSVAWIGTRQHDHRCCGSLRVKEVGSD